MNRPKIKCLFASRVLHWRYYTNPKFTLSSDKATMISAKKNTFELRFFSMLGKLGMTQSSNKSKLLAQMIPLDHSSGTHGPMFLQFLTHNLQLDTVYWRTEMEEQVEIWLVYLCHQGWSLRDTHLYGRKSYSHGFPLSRHIQPFLIRI